MQDHPARYHRRSIRLRGYGYAGNGAYFVTICTANRACILSKVDSSAVGAGLAPALDDETSPVIIHLTKAGEIVKRNWLAIPERYPNVFLDEYVIMPNHLHGIIMILSKVSRATARVAPTLGQMIGAFKSRCVTDYLKYIDENKVAEVGRIWQRNDYEHVIRNEADMARTREYTLLNPDRWADDEENPDNIHKR